MWTKKPYGNASGELDGGRWTISNGHLNFKIHLTIDGSIKKERADADGYIVNPKQADAYAEQIVRALNDADVGVYRA